MNGMEDQTDLIIINYIISVKYSQMVTSEQDNFQVFVRIRPSKQQSTFIRASDQSIYVASHIYEKRQKKYQFSQVYQGTHKNDEIWEKSIKNQLQLCSKGFNLTMLAYGVTGSGKTHTIFGNQNEQGLAIKSFVHMMASNPKCEFKISFLEIYNENVRDLLSTSEPKNLSIMEENNKILIPELKEFPIHSEADIRALLQTGNQKRVLAANNLNEASSRSHAIIQFSMLNQSQHELIQSKLTVIDLAGSEKNFENQSNKMAIEGSNINRSLLALGNCINALSQSKKHNFIPYRDSKLTRILKESLSGNSKSFMFACISPNFVQYEQTLNTIYYASRASKIKKKIQRNVMKTVMIRCANCKHQMATHDLTHTGKDHVGESIKTSQVEEIRNKMESISIESIRKKIDDVIEQSSILSKRSEQSSFHYNSTILREVFEINKLELDQQLSKIQTIFRRFTQSTDKESDKQNIGVNVNQEKKDDFYIKSSRNSDRPKEDDRIRSRNSTHRVSEQTQRMKRDFEEYVEIPQLEVNLRTKNRTLVEKQGSWISISKRLHLL